MSDACALESSPPLAVAFGFVLLEHGSSRYFFGSAAITAGSLGLFFDVFILALLFGADASKVFRSRHDSSCSVFCLYVGNGTTPWARDKLAFLCNFGTEWGVR